MLLYSIGHGILAIVAGTSIGFVQKLSSSKKYGKVSTVLKIAIGTMILLIGLYMFYLGFKIILKGENYYYGIVW